jgi:Protein of unknown function (DUF2851)
MNEKLLHFIWKFRLFDQSNLVTTEDEPVELVNQGMYNTNAGADFQQAKIRIGKTLWAGNVEIHIRSADWLAHRHNTDAAYNNVILHVVFEQNGTTARRLNGEDIPTIELKSRIKPELLSRYEELEKRKDWIPCARFFKDANPFVTRSFLDRLLVERLEGKVAQVNALLEASDNDWENVMFQMIARYLGASINKEEFQTLAKSLPVKIWAKYNHDSMQIEALVFGQAGFLETPFDDDYPNQLRKEYNYLKRLHQLEPMEKHVWKFLRLRPANFPSVRMAQLAALMCKEVKLLSQILEARDVKLVHDFFDIEVSDYWHSHYQFDRPSRKSDRSLGTGMKNILLINVVAPVLFAYGKYKGNEDYCERAIQLLESCRPESNTVIDGWKAMDMKPANAFESQYLLQLKGEYCDKFRCLDCAIGHGILAPPKPSPMGKA